MAKTDLKRDILIKLKNNPDATNKEIANAVGCSPSYVSTVKNEFSDYTSVDAMQDQLDKELDDFL
jgi:predicted transcriptional regulator